MLYDIIWKEGRNHSRVGHMSSVFSQVIRRFGREEKGVVLIIVVLLIVPLMMVIAVGIDLGQSLIVKRQLSSGVDAAALAIGTDPDITDQQMLEDKAEAFIKSHYRDAGIGELTGFTVNREVNPDNQDIEVNVTASARVTTSFMKLGGVDTLDVSAMSKVVRRERYLEVVMVLDNSGSMGGTKLTALKTAANNLVTILFNGQETSENVKIGLVPFVGGVNVNVPHTTSWLDNGNPAPLNLLYFLDLDLTSLIPESTFTVLDSMSGGIASNWGGCVRSRYNFPADDLDTTDTPPDASVPATLFSPYFNPYMSSTLPHSKTLYVGQSSNSQNANCPQTPIQPLTNVKSTITSAVNAMTAAGNTNIPHGLVWGWRLISPGEPFADDPTATDMADRILPYSDPRSIKALIVLTDGENNGGDFSSYGKPGALNPQLGSNHTSALNARLATLCENIKQNQDDNPDDQDIQLYAITFGISGSVAEMMEVCANPGNFYDSPNETDLQSAFTAIATGLNQLRIAQ